MMAVRNWTILLRPLTRRLANYPTNLNGAAFEETLGFNNNGKEQWDENSFNYTPNSNKVVIDYDDGDLETWTFSVFGATLSMTAEDGVKYSFTKR